MQGTETDSFSLSKMVLWLIFIDQTGVCRLFSRTIPSETALAVIRLLQIVIPPILSLMEVSWQKAPDQQNQLLAPQ